MSVDGESNREILVLFWFSEGCNTIFYLFSEFRREGGQCFIFCQKMGWGRTKILSLIGRQTL